MCPKLFSEWDLLPASFMDGHYLNPGEQGPPVFFAETLTDRDNHKNGKQPDKYFSKIHHGPGKDKLWMVLEEEKDGGFRSRVHIPASIRQRSNSACFSSKNRDLLP